MELLIGLVFIGIAWALSKSTEWKFDNYMPPEGMDIDYNAQSLDRIKNHLSKEQVMKNTIEGKYNKKR